MWLTLIFPRHLILFHIKKRLHELYNYGIRYELLAWIECFLQDRTQCVFVDDQLSYFISVLSGVIQGSGLDPLLFSLFINDSVELFDAPNVCKLFTDDVELYSVIGIGASVTLEPGLACLVRWSNTWQLHINSSKCFILHNGINNPTMQYSIARFNVSNVSDVRDLGATYDNQLKFEEYINSIVSISYQRIYSLFRGFVSRDITLPKRAYCTYVRPILEYCTQYGIHFYLKTLIKLSMCNGI